jgi:hypothetical protein
VKRAHDIGKHVEETKSLVSVEIKRSKKKNGSKGTILSRLLWKIV